MPSADAGDADAMPAPPPQTRAAISHVIFDMDGLLLDTEGFYTTVQEKILMRFGKVFDWSVKAKMMGKTTAESTRILFEEFGLAGLLTPEQFLEERETMLKKLLPTCVAMPGLLRLINLLHTNGIPIAVATGHVVMVPDPRLDVSHHKGADQVLTSLLEFNPSEWGLPPFVD
ncbi:(DL)-glycerol-3-phosphatase 2 [Zea mays]|uniref:(DL)-glycerol-3-phosphatase 2 n=1 Tax=Zea mays TaxID=4577 RepID=A0A1D6IXS1_MAIZE|nr:(DL)-glycerol-3-phosphatase 2 [Zea mays]